MRIFNTYIGDDAAKETPEQILKAQLRASEDKRLRTNIMWGIVQGMFLYSLIMIPVLMVLGLIVDAMK